MENASKALLMAGGILIALLIISSLVLLFNQLETHEDAETAQKRIEQVSKFNNQFIAYDGREDITLNELYSLYNKIESINQKALNGEVGYYNVNSNLIGLKITSNSGSKYNVIEYFNSVFKTNNKDIETDKQNLKFGCKIKYNRKEGGRVDYLEFNVK